MQPRSPEVTRVNFHLTACVHLCVCVCVYVFVTVMELVSEWLVDQRQPLWAARVSDTLMAVRLACVAAALGTKAKS